MRERPGNRLTPGNNFSAGPPSPSSRRGPARANRLRLPLVPVGQKADRRDDHRVCQGAEGVDGSTRPPGAGALDQRTTGEARKRSERRARLPRSDRSDGAPAAARRQRLLAGEVVATKSQELRGTPPGHRALGRRTAVPSPSRSLPSSPAPLMETRPAGPTAPAVAFFSPLMSGFQGAPPTPLGHGLLPCPPFSFRAASRAFRAAARFGRSWSALR